MAYYGINGNPLSVIYDIHGNIISQKPTSEKTSLDYSIPSTEFFTHANKQLTAMKEKYYATDERSVPLFISTDEHQSGGMDSHRWFSNNNDICAVDLQLGDVCNDYYVESYLDNMATRAAPVTNYIGIPGNHDVKQTSDVPTQDKIRAYFAWNNSYRCRTIDTDNASYVVYDDVHGIKFICCDWYTKIGENANGTMPSPHTTTAVTDWFLNELTANEGYDIIVLQHALFMDTYLKPDGTKQDWADAPAGMKRLWAVMKDRKNKRSGIYVDDDGVSHAYDFTGCTDDLLCTLHGHAHEQLSLREDGLTSIAFGSWWTVNYAVIDRTNRSFHLWTNRYNSASDEIIFDL